MRRISIVLLVAVTALLCASILWAEDIFKEDGTEIFDLKERWLEGKGHMPPVMFPHTFHQDKNDYVCIKCHDSNDGGPFELEGEIRGIDYSNAAHNFCWTCHMSKNVTAVGHTCSRCHVSDPSLMLVQ